MKRKALLASMFSVAMSLSLGAEADVIDIDDYSINFNNAGIAEGHGAGLANLHNVDEWKVTAFSVVGFYDTDSSGNITSGDLFEDYIIVRIDGFQEMFGGNITPAGYGTVFEMTAILEATGVQGMFGPNTYGLTALNQYDIMFDAGGGGGFTQAKLNATPSGGGETFVDGIVVEQGVPLVAGGGNSTGPVNPDGTIDVITGLYDVLTTLDCGGGAGSCGNLEFNFKDQFGTSIIAGDGLLGVVDANNDFEYSSLVGGTPSPLGQAYIKAVDHVFGNLSCAGVATASPSCSGSMGAFDFFFATKSDGSFNKNAIPEPNVLVLFGLGLLGLGAAKLRRRTA